MSQIPVETWVNRYVARVRFGEFLQRAAECLAVFLFAFGGAVLAVKLLLPQFWPHVLWLAVGAVPAGVAAWWLAKRSPISRADSVAMLDSALGLRGLLMTVSERPEAEWVERLPQASAEWQDAIPQVRPRRFVKMLVLPLTFAIAAGLVPLREAETAPIKRNTVAQKATEELEQLLASLDETRVLEQEEEQQLRAEIEKLKQETEQSPLTHEKWETVDALQERMRLRVESAATLAEQAGDAAAQLAESAAAELNGLSNEQLNSLQGALEAVLQQGDFSQAPENLQELLQQMTQNGQLQLPENSAEREKLLQQLEEQLQKMAADQPESKAKDAAELLRKIKKQAEQSNLSKERQEELQKNLEQSLKRLAKRGGFDKASRELQDQVQRLTKRGQLDLPTDPAERKKMLDELREHLDSESQKLCDLRGKCKACRPGEGNCEGDGQGEGEGNGQPGRGGVSRGRGDAPLSWGDESDENGNKFKEVVLPQGFLEQPKDETVGVRLTAPNVDAPDTAARGGARAIDAAAGGTTYNRRLSPRHRNVVRKFFDTGANEK